MQQFIKSVTAIMLAVLSLLGFAKTPYDEPVDNYNGGDPFIVETEDGTYYTYTTGGGVDILKTESFDKIEVTEKKTVFWAGENGTVGDIWAPEIHKIGDRWYIVAAALFDRNLVPEGSMPEAKEYEDNNDYYRYSFVLESDTDDIFGEYTFKGIIAPDGLNTIDGTYLEQDGKLYFLCSAYVNIAHQCLYIAEMENPYTLKADESGNNNAVCISRPTFHWEKKGWWVNEGPAVLKNGDDLFIVYSASGYSSGGYCMGLLTYAGGEVMSPCSWIKSPTRLSYHKAAKNIYHAGHCSFLYRENGEIYMVYHATPTRDFFASPRLTYIKPVEFAFGKPII